MYIEDAVRAVYALHHCGVEPFPGEEGREQDKIPAPGVAVNIASEDTPVVLSLIHISSPRDRQKSRMPSSA